MQGSYGPNANLNPGDLSHGQAVAAEQDVTRKERIEQASVGYRGEL